MNNRQLYESIMLKVAKQVKKTLNESYASVFSDDNPYNAALMNLDDVRKCMDDTDSTEDFWNTFDKLQDIIEELAAKWDEENEMKVSVDPMNISEGLIKYAMLQYEKTSKKYNPHLDGDKFKEFIKKCIDIQGNKANLNWIDTSEVTDMTELFRSISFEDRTYYFNGDISEWDVSNVTDMTRMFLSTMFFNGDVSKWDVSNVTDMQGMFSCCLRFNCDISKWDVSNVRNMHAMFYECPIKNQYKPRLH